MSRPRKALNEKKLSVTFSLSLDEISLLDEICRQKGGWTRSEFLLRSLRGTASKMGLTPQTSPTRGPE